MSCRQGGNQRILPMDEKIVIEDVVDEFLRRLRNLGKITDHPLIIQGFRMDRNRRFDAVPMQVFAFTRVPHEAVTVAKVDVLSDGIHGPVPSYLRG